MVNPDKQLPASKRYRISADASAGIPKRRLACQAEARPALRRGHSRRGLTIIELLVVLAIISVLMALLLPAVGQAREAARRMTCRSHLRQMGIALHNYNDLHRTLPPAEVAAAGPDGPCLDDDEVEIEDNHGRCTEYASWATLCLPQLDHTALSELYSNDHPWSDLVNRPAVSTRPDVFVCPTSPGVRIDTHHVRGAAPMDYGAVTEVEQLMFTNVLGIQDPGVLARQGVLSEHTSADMSQTTDGLSNSIFVAECAGRPHVYVSGGLMTAVQFLAYTGNEVLNDSGSFVVQDGTGWGDPDTTIDVGGMMPNGVQQSGPVVINAINTGEVYSFHAGGANVLFADGSVRFLSESIDTWVFVTRCTRAGGEGTDGR